MWCKKNSTGKISWLLVLCISFSVLFSGMTNAYADENVYADEEENLCEKYGIDEDFQGELIVKYEKLENKGLLSRMNRLFSSAENADSEELRLCEVDPEEGVQEALENLESEGEIEYIEPNRTLKICESEVLKDKYIDYQWALKDIEAFQAWNELGDLQGTSVVAVLDTGVDYTHPDLKDKIIKGENFVKDRKDGSKYPFDYGVMDDNGHGTFASGVITANYNNGIGVAGLAGSLDVKVLAVKVMNDDGEGNIFEISEGIRYAADENADVINLSLGGEGYSQTMANAVKYAQEKGVLVVAAAGNDGKDGSNFYPAAYSGVLTVGAVGPDESIASFSNYGEALDLMAPGVQIYSTSIKKEAAFGDEEEGYYAQFNGTSFSCPYTAGVAAVYKIIHPDASAEAIKEALIQTAVDMEDTGWDEKTGYGKLDMFAAVNPDTDLERIIRFEGIKRNDYLKGEIKLKANILNAEAGINSVRFYLDEVRENNLIGEGITEDNEKYSLSWNTQNYQKGSHELIAVAFKKGELIQKDTVSIQIVNDVKSGILLNVKDPEGNAGVNAFVNVYVKDIVNKDYDRIYTGRANELGLVRIPATLGKDLSKVYVVATGSFDCEDMKKGSAIFIYQKELSGPGEFEISGAEAQPVHFKTTDKNGSELVNVAYYATVTDKDGINIGTTNELNSNKETAPVVYADGGRYDFFSYGKKDGNTYFLTQWGKQINKNQSAQSLAFDGSKTGQVHLNTDQETKVKSGIIYLYNDKTNASLGMKLGGENIYVSADNYRYKIDAAVKDPENGEDWIYTFDSGKKGILVPENGTTEVKVGGGLAISSFDLSYEAVEEHVAEANKIYDKNKIQIIDENGETIIKFPIGYELFQTMNRFSDNYGNFLCGISRGSLNNTSIISQEETAAAQDDEEEEDPRVLKPRFRVLDENRDWIYPIYWDLVGGHEDGESSVNFFEFTFWDIMSLDGKVGDYELQLSLEKNALCDKKLAQVMNVRLYDEKLHKILSYDKGHITNNVNEDTNLTVPYLYIYSLKKNQEVDAISSATSKEDNPMGGGEVDAISSASKKANGYYWEQTYGAWGNQYQNEEDFGTVALDSSIKLSKVKDGNLAIIRYTLKDGKTYAYLFRQFTDYEDLGNEIDLQELGLKKASIQDLRVDGKKLEHMESSNNIIFQAKIDGQNMPIRMPVFTENVWVEKGKYSFDGQYISHPDSNGNQTNYYMLEKDVQMDRDTPINFDLSKNAKIVLEANSNGYKKWKGSALLPFSDYNHTFKIEDSQGSIFYVPADIEYQNINVVLGLADSEKPSYIWNYLLQIPQELELEAGKEYSLNVGGKFRANVELKKTNFINREKLEGYSGIVDEFGNRLLSTRVSADHEWFDVNKTADITTVYSLSGYRVNTGSYANKQDYVIQHDTTDNANIVYPYMRLYQIDSGKEKMLYNEAKAEYYHSFNELLTGLSKGNYRVEIAFAGSPNGVVTTSNSEGLFSIAAETNKGGGGGRSTSGKTEKESVKPSANEEVKTGKTDFTVIAPLAKLNKDSKELYQTVTLTVDKTLDKNKAVAVSYDKETNSYNFVPSTFEQIDGKWVAAIKLTASTEVMIVEREKTFKDIQNHWARKEIDNLASKFIVNGVNEQAFEPDRQVTRAEFISMLVRALNLQAEGQDAAFKDIKSGAWYRNSVSTGTRLGLIQGYEDNSFRPNKSISREEMAVMIERAMKLAGKDPKDYDYDKTLSTFVDQEQMSNWSKDSISTMVSTGITTGRENGTYAPEGNATRAETIVVLYRLLKYIEFM